MNDSRDVVLVRARAAAWVLLLGAFVGTDLQAADAVPRKPFRGHERVALLEVEKADGPYEGAVGGNLANQFGVSVKIIGQLPAAAREPKQARFLVLHERLSPRPGWEMPLGMHYWFPVEVGKRVVIAFDGEIDDLKGSLSEPMVEPVLTTADASADAIWHDCQTFHDALHQKKEALVPALTRALREQPQRLGENFFYFINEHDRRLVDDKAFSLAAAAYLRNPAVPVRTRMEIVLSLRAEDKRDAETNKTLVSALVQLALEAKRTAKQANLAPSQIETLLDEISSQFISQQPLTALPKVAASTREELLALTADKEVVPNQRAVVPLRNWLQGKPPGETPHSGRDKPRGREGSRKPQQESSEDAIRGQQPPPRQDSASDPQTQKPQPNAEPFAGVNSGFWPRTVAIATGILGGLALLLGAITLVRKRKATP